MGGSSIMNSAIMMRLPDFVRQASIEEDGLEFLKDESLDASYDRIFEMSKVEPTPLAVQGRRNLLFRDAMASVGLAGAPLPRAVSGCEGLNGRLHHRLPERAQAVRQSHLRRRGQARRSLRLHDLDGGAHLGPGRSGRRRRRASRQSEEPRRTRQLHGARAAGRAGRGRGADAGLLQFNGIAAGGTVGSSFFAHIGAGILGHFKEVVDPWVGATQGWGAMAPGLDGMKFESLWAPPSLILIRWGDVGEAFLSELAEIEHTTVAGLVYRGKVRGAVRLRQRAPEDEAPYSQGGGCTKVLEGARLAVDGLFNIGAKAVHIGISRTKTKIERREEAHQILSQQYRPNEIPMTANHIFGSVPMSLNRQRGSVDLAGKLRGMEGIWVADASLFPSPSAVNPQATVMALSDRVSRMLGELSRGLGSSAGPLAV